MDAALCHKHALKLVHYVEWERLRHEMQYCAMAIRKDGVLVYCHARRGPLIRMNSKDKPRIGFGGGCVGRRTGKGDRGRGPGRAKNSSISMADFLKKRSRKRPGRVLGVVFRPQFLGKNQVRKTTPSVRRGGCWGWFFGFIFSTKTRSEKPPPAPSRRNPPKKNRRRVTKKCFF